MLKTFELRQLPEREVRAAEEEAAAARQVLEALEYIKVPQSPEPRPRSASPPGFDVLPGVNAGEDVNPVPPQAEQSGVSSPA